jgi:hypothetical protein
MGRAIQCNAWLLLRSSRDQLLRPAGLLTGFLLFAVVVIPNAFTAWALGHATTSSEFDELRRQQLRVVGKMYGSDVAQMVQAVPSTLGMAGVVSLLVVPAAVLVMASGMLDANRRGSLLPFEVARMPRSAVMAARTLGSFIAFASVLLLAFVGLAIFVAAVDPAGATLGLLRWTIRLWAVCAASAFAYVALIALVNAVVPRAGPALAWGAAALVFLFLLRRAEFWNPAWLEWLFPAANDASLLKFDAGAAAHAAFRTVLWALVVAGAGALVYRRRSL